MKKGFTLIELLAVIVILAIIALIATPIVLNIIEESRENADLRSAEMYLDAVEIGIVRKATDGGVPNGTYDILEDGDLCLEYSGTTCSKRLEVEVDGTIPSIGSTVTITKGSITDVLLLLNDKTIVKNDKGQLVSLIPTPSECFTYLDNYDYTINKDACMNEFVGMLGDTIIDTETGELMCSGDKSYSDLINFAHAVGYSKEQLEQMGVITIEEKNQNGNGTLSITGYTCGGESGTHKDVVIPKEINGKLVTSIGVAAFSFGDINGNEREEVLINSVVIPNSVTTIGWGAFSSNQLTSVTIPNSVTTIEKFAFHLNRLTSITIPNSVITIEEAAFVENKLASVTIGNSVTTIGKEAFAGNDLTSVTIPNSVITIEEAAFIGNQLTSVTLGNSVTTISYDAFANNQLTSVTIPNSVTTIGWGAFANNNLTSVAIGNSVTTIEEWAFFNNKLTSVVIKGKSSTADFLSYGEEAFGWAEGYSDADITWNP